MIVTGRCPDRDLGNTAFDDGSDGPPSKKRWAEAEAKQAVKEGRPPPPPDHKYDGEL